MRLSWLWGRRGHLLRHLSHLRLETTVEALWAIAATACAVGALRIIAAIGIAVTPSTSADGYRKALGDTSVRALTWTLTRIHAVIV